MNKVCAPKGDLVQIPQPRDPDRNRGFFVSGDLGDSAEFGFLRQRAGGKARARRDDGVCLTTLRARVPGPYKEEFSVKRLPDRAERLKAVMEQKRPGHRLLKYVEHSYITEHYIRFAMRSVLCSSEYSCRAKNPCFS